MSRISVVVPVYNVVDYLDWCLESLETQTMADIEIICVNDGSTDSSREKLGVWAERDGRIRIIDKPNGGLSSARNAGIAAATSRYVCFLDSDDRFHPHACEVMVGMLDQTGADVLTFGGTCYPPTAGYQWLNAVLSPREVVYDGFSPDLLFKEASRPFAWRTACRTEFLRENDIRFEDGFGEDQVFHFAIYPRARKTVLIPEKLYDYRVVREGSLMDRWRGDMADKMLEHVGIVKRIFADWERGGFLDQYASDMLAFALDFALYDAIKLDDASYRKVAVALRKVLASYWSAGRVKTMQLPSATRRMALNACYDPTMSSSRRKMLVAEYYAQKYGVKALVNQIRSKAGKRSG